MNRLMALTCFTGLMQAGTGMALTPPEGKADKITFAEQIGPMVYEHCSICHRPGTAAPFSLLNYNDVRKHARTMLRAMSSHFMPPWQPAAGWGDFIGARNLSDDQIGMFKTWLNDGMPEGDKAKAPKPPEFSGGWQMGKPDQVVTMDQDFVVPADGPDIYQNFVIPLNLKENKWVTGIEFQATSPAVVHHILYFLDSSGRGRKLATKFGKPDKPGFPGMGFTPTGTLGGWAVGGIPSKLPQGLSRPLTKESDLVLQTHFHPSGTEEKCKLTIALYYSDKPSPRTLIQGMMFPPNFARFIGLDIPPGKKDYTLRDSFTLPVPLDVVGVAAHAHYVGKSFKGVATLPDGTTKNLFLIKDWDFNWQGTYYYKDFIHLPKGTKIDVEIVYDNSAENPRNPNSPPVRITWGEGTTDEMGALMFITVPSKESDVPALRKTIVSHVKAAYDDAVKRGYKIPDIELPDPANDKDKKEDKKKPSDDGKGIKTTSAFTQLPVELADITGKMQQPLTTGDHKANVLFFVTNDCPISNGYAPEIASIVKEYSEKGVAFFVVQVDPDLTTPDAVNHAKRFKLPCPVVIDRKHDLVKAAGATITPEVAVFGRTGKVEYLGRIDDQYPGLGKKRTAPTQRDLRNALDAMVAGTPVKVAKTEAVGCSIGDVP